MKKRGMNNANVTIHDIVSGERDFEKHFLTRKKYNIETTTLATDTIYIYIYILGRRSICISLHVAGGIIIATVLLTCCCTLIVRKKCARIVDKLTGRKKKELVRGHTRCSVFCLRERIHLFSLLPFKFE